MSVSLSREGAALAQGGVLAQLRIQDPARFLAFASACTRASGEPDLPAADRALLALARARHRAPLLARLKLLGGGHAHRKADGQGGSSPR